MILVCEAIMASRGGIPREARILDFGCGQGRHVREFRAASYDRLRAFHGLRLGGQRDGAWTLHIFPARWRPVEPHIFTPFGGRFQHPAVISL
jgi:hypothetical protein